MPSTTNADGLPGMDDFAGRLAMLADRTSLLAIDDTLRALPGDGVKALAGLTGALAAAEVASLARRMLQATRDFGAVIHDDTMPVAPICESPLLEAVAEPAE